VHGKQLARTAGGHDNGARANFQQLACLKVDCHDAAHKIAILEQTGHQNLVTAVNVTLVNLAPQGLHDGRAKRIAFLDRARIGLRRIELALNQLAICFTIEPCAEGFDVLHSLHRFGGKNPRKLGICQAIAAADGIGVMHVGVIPWVGITERHLKAGDRRLGQTALTDNSL
jgi:hypothetical protein